MQAIEKDNPEVTVSYEFADAVSMRLVHCTNSYDALIISGSMELLLSASIRAENQLFESIYG